MGMSPDQVDACALWKFTAALNGWKRANTPAEKQKANISISDEHMAELGIEGFVDG